MAEFQVKKFLLLKLEMKEHISILFRQFRDDVHLEAERTGEPVNERHLASIQKTHSIVLQQMDEDLSEFRLAA